MPYRQPAMKRTDSSVWPTAALLFAALLVSACSVNPVTGDRELVLVSEAQELELGRQNYAPMQQSQGGVYDIDRELTAFVSEVGQKLAAVSDRQLPYEFVVLNNSVPNAWALPGGKIAINRGLLTELESEAELAAVLGHEIVHAAARHSAQQMSRATLLQGLVLATAVATSDSDYGSLAVGGAAVGSQLISAQYGQGAELESDKYGMRYMSRAGYDPQGAVSLQETFVRLSEGRNPDWLSGLFASHPPSQARVQANRQTAANLPPGGRVGADTYAAAMARTLQLKPAYERYDEGRAALADEDTAKALRLANEAIELFPGEANFYSLRGDARLIEREFDKAVTNFDSAIRRRDGFFYYYLQRGRAKQQLGSLDAAEQDLVRSMGLLETAPAHYALGEIAEQRGDRAAALEHYRAVAGSGGAYGKAAAARVVRLDLPANPARYVPRRCDPDADGDLVVSVRNDTELALADVTVLVEYADATGRARQQRQTIRGPLQPGEVARVQTGLGPYTGSSCPATVTGARIVE